MILSKDEFGGLFAGETQGEWERRRACELHDLGWSYHRIGRALGISYQTTANYVKENSPGAVFREDCKEKAKARPKQAVSKKRPRVIIAPSDFKEKIPWWEVVPPILRVNIITGRVLVFRWPLQ